MSLCYCVFTRAERQLCNTPDAFQEAFKTCVILKGSCVCCYKLTMAFIIDWACHQMLARGRLNAPGVCVPPLCLTEGHVITFCLAHSINSHSFPIPLYTHQCGDSQHQPPSDRPWLMGLGLYFLWAAQFGSVWDGTHLYTSGEGYQY